MEARDTPNSSAAFNGKLRVVMLGLTGAGKSEFGNILIGKRDVFESSASGDSCTSFAKQAESSWFGKKSEGELLVVDTCGFGDSKGRSEIQFEELLQKLINFGYVHSFLIILNGSQCRLDSLTQEMFSKLKDAFTEKIFNHVMVVYTHWPYKVSDIKKREKEMQNLNKDKSNPIRTKEELRESEIDGLLSPKALLPNGNKIKIPCIFVDSIDQKETDPDEVSEREKNLLSAQLKKLQDFCKSRSQFDCLKLEGHLNLLKSLDLKKQEDKEFLIKIKNQKAEIDELMKDDPPFKKQFINCRENQMKKRIDLMIELGKKFDSYFDERNNLNLLPSLLNDIWKISSWYNKNDSSKRFFQNNFVKDLEKDLNEKLPKIIEERLKHFIREQAEAFVKYCEGDLKNMFDGTKISTTLDLTAEGITGLAVGAFSTAGLLALAEIGLMAVFGIVGMIFLATGGIVMLVKSLVWSREEAVVEFAKKATDKIATADMKKRLQDICSKSLNRVGEEIIYRTNQQLIGNYRAS